MWFRKLCFHPPSHHPDSSTIASMQHATIPKTWKPLLNITKDITSRDARWLPQSLFRGQSHDKKYAWEDHLLWWLLWCRWYLKRSTVTTKMHQNHANTSLENWYRKHIDFYAKRVPTWRPIRCKMSSAIDANNAIETCLQNHETSGAAERLNPANHCNKHWFWRSCQVGVGPKKSSTIIQTWPTTSSKKQNKSM